MADDTMVERVAKAILDHSEAGSHEAVHLARLVIAAMREPTEAMLAEIIVRPDALIAEREAGGAEGYAERMDAAVAIERLALAQRWRAMIDEALKP